MKDVTGYVGLYAITRGGRVWAYPKKSRRIGRWLKQATSHLGYKYVSLFKAGATRKIYVHRLVARAYIPRQKGRKHVNHKNGDRTFNRVTNLEWVTPSENKIHAFATGLTRITLSQRLASRRNITAYNKAKQCQVA